MSKARFILAHDQARRRAVSAVTDAPEGYAVMIAPPSRSLAQNAAQWPLLEAFSRQLLWPVNGSMVAMSADEWKHVLSAAFHGDTVRLAQGLNGGVVMLGMRTSKMSKRQFSDWLEFLHSVAADRGVKIDPAGE